MWYSTYKEAEEACKEKEKEYGVEFYVLKDVAKLSNAYDPTLRETYIYWAQRKIKDE